MPEGAGGGIGRRLALRANVRLWSLLLPFLALRCPLPDLLRRTAPVPATPYRGLSASFVLRQVKRACRRPLLMRDRPCLREGLLAWRFLRQCGYRPVLHFGIDRTSVGRVRMEAHCWLTLDGKTLLNPPTPNYVEIHRVDAAPVAVPGRVKTR